MKAAPFEYVRATSVPHAIELLQQHAGRAKLMSGGQSLGPMLNLRLARPAVVVDISAVPELRQVTQQDGMLRVGAAVTHAEIEDGAHEPLRGSVLQEVAGGIAYRAVRTRGTLGGSLAHADPAADWVLAAVALGAQVEIAGPGGSRRVDADAFMQGAYTTVLDDAEIISAVHIPPAHAQARWSYFKFCRKTGEFAHASCAAWFDARARVARIAVGALDGAPRLLPALAARVAQEGLAALPQQDILREMAALMPDKDGVQHTLHGTAVRRCLARLFEGRETQ